MAEHLSGPLAVALGRCAQQAALGAGADPEQRKLLIGAARELNQLRRGDQLEQRLRAEREERARQLAQEEKRKRLNAESDARLARQFPDLFPGTETGSARAITPELRAVYLEIKKLPGAKPCLAAAAAPPNPAKSK